MTRRDSTEQLILELYVSDLKASCEFYTSYGFTLVREEPNFAELKWDDSLLFLEQVADNPEPPLSPVGNVRIMVDNVDGYWALSKKLGARVRSEEHTSELQSRFDLVCRLLLEKKK